jgi:hypothetical protein
MRIAIVTYKKGEILRGTSWVKQLQSKYLIKQLCFGVNMDLFFLLDVIENHWRGLNLKGLCKS